MAGKMRCGWPRAALVLAAVVTALTGCEKQEDPIADNLRGRLEAALQIEPAVARDLSLQEVALAAAEAGRGKIVEDVLLRIESRIALETTAGEAAIRLGKAGNMKAAQDVANLIESETLRDDVLRRLASVEVEVEAASGDAPAEHEELRGRLKAAKDIQTTAQRNQALRTVALKAAKEGTAEVVCDAVKEITVPAMRDATARESALVLAKAGRSGDAAKVANLIETTRMRDDTLEEIATH